jgi:hypothetical protein
LNTKKAALLHRAIAPGGFEENRDIHDISYFSKAGFTLAHILSARVGPPALSADGRAGRASSGDVSAVRALG